MGQTASSQKCYELLGYAEKTPDSHKSRFVKLAADQLSDQVQYLRNTERNINKKDAKGIMIKPDRLRLAVFRADCLLDELCEQAINKESDKFKKENLKSTYAIRGKGFGRGTSLSHPRMDFLALTPKVAQKLKIKT